MPERLTDSERVEFALQTERDGSRFYKDATERVQHKLARAAFQLLSKEELRHVALIEALAKRLKGKGGPVSADSPNLRKLELGVKTIYETAGEKKGKGDLDPAKAYEEAVALEQKISALYSGYIKDSESPEARHLFTVLYREEQDHLNLLEDMLAYLTKPDQWFIDRDMTLLDGG
jgi:rubrerythrin